MLKFTSNEAIKLMEEKLLEVTKEIKELNKCKSFLILGGSNPLKRAAYFGILFAKTPLYDDLISRTIQLAPYFELIND